MACGDLHLARVSGGAVPGPHRRACCCPRSRPPATSRSGQLWTIPSELYWGNYAEVLGNPAVHRYFLNTLLVTAPATVASIALGSLAGYVFAKLPFRGSNLLFLVIVSGMFFPPQVILIPLFRLFNAMELIDTLYPIVIIHTAMGIPICTLLMRKLLRHRPECTA